MSYKCKEWEVCQYSDAEGSGKDECSHQEVCKYLNAEKALEKKCIHPKDFDIWDGQYQKCSTCGAINLCINCKKNCKDQTGMDKCIVYEPIQDAEKAEPTPKSDEQIQIDYYDLLNREEKDENEALYKTCEAIQNGTLKKAFEKAERCKHTNYELIGISTLTNTYRCKDCGEVNYMAKAERCPEFSTSILLITARNTLYEAKGQLEAMIKWAEEKDFPNDIAISMKKGTVRNIEDMLKMLEAGKLSTSGISEEEILKIIGEWSILHLGNTGATDNNMLKLAHAIMEAL